MKKIAAVVGLILAGGLLFVYVQRASAPSHPNTPASPAPPAAQPSFNKQMYSIDAPDSIWMIVNKERALPSGYAPANVRTVGGGQLRPEASDAITKLIAAAKTDGINLKIISAYRSYASQTSVYGGYVAADGQANADTYSARPGHSEHQTGLAADLGDQSGNCDLQTCFGNTAASQWLAAHCADYGFIIRYLPGKTAITGYQYEPWHIRFVGPELAGQIGASGQTLEEFFGVVPAKQPY